MSMKHPDYRIRKAKALTVFTNSDMNERASIVWTSGKLLDCSFVSGATCNIYFLQGFFVEVVMDTQTCKITQIEPFIGNSARLDKYASKVDIYSLL